MPSKIQLRGQYRQIMPPADLFAGMHLAETEREILGNVPLESAHLLLLFVPPLLVTLAALLIVWRREFGLGGRGKA